ncbi:pantetheine-phosphate adenylyltransferase [soil metagenome]
MRSMTSAIYPGSFDPVTRGHLHVVEHGLAMFEHLTVAVGINDHKRPTFTTDERIDMLREVLPFDDRLTIVAIAGLVVDYCRKHRIGVILRGSRTTADAETERQLALMNRRLEQSVATVVVPSADHGYVSSSLMREVVGNGGDVNGLLHPSVERRLRDRSPAHRP